LEIATARGSSHASVVTGNMVAERALFCVVC